MEGSDVLSSADRSRTGDEAALGEDTTQWLTGSTGVLKASDGPGCAKGFVGCAPCGACEVPMACITAANWVPRAAIAALNCEVTMSASAGGLPNMRPVWGCACNLAASPPWKAGNGMAGGGTPEPKAPKPGEPPEGEPQPVLEEPRMPH
jgi:hypothetical protein